MDTSYEFSVCESLQSCAKRTGVFFANLAVQQFAPGAKANTTHALIANLATRLFTLASFLAEPAVPISPEIEDHAIKVLLTLRKVFIVATDQTAPCAIDILGEIETRLDDWDRDREASRVIYYFQAHPSEAEALSQLCDSLRSKVSTSTKSWHTTTSLPKTFTVPEPNHYESSLNKILYNSVKLHMKCDHVDDRGCERQMCEPCADTWLPTRLRLGGPFQSSNWAVFDVVTSSLKQGFWNQFRWVIPRQTTKKKSDIKLPRVRFDIKVEETKEEDEYDHPIDDPDIELLDPGYICNILDSSETSLRIKLKLIPETGLVEWRFPDSVEPLFPHNGVNLLNVLQSYYPLTLKDKITLSHTLAQAFWQLYASDMMQSVWTSETLWFMHEHKRDDNGDPLNAMPDELPVSPYIIFDFGCDEKKFDESPQWSSRRSLPHRFPHILALGALLLDIGLGRSVGNANYRSLQNRDHMIRALSYITSGLKQLEDTKWDGFTLHKSYFIQAIRFCATYNGQESNSESKSYPIIQEHTGSTTTSDSSLAIMTRKKVLYENVIRPLAWLAGAFHENSKNVTCAYNLPTPYIQRLQVAASGPTLADTGTLGPGARFNDSDQWLQIFRDFAALTYKLIKSITYKTQQAPPIFRIAILDTGYNANMASFKERRQAAGQILGQISWIDFASNPPSPQPIDEDGHGSYMTQLVMNTAPLADIQVIRVARKREGILQDKNTIAEAIIHAGLREMVDIISMSFGFEGDDDNVRVMHDAITTVHKERKGRVIFLAAASNDSSHQNDMFPARHPYVIPMHATNEKGDFVFNPSTSECILGTFSEGPREILQELVTEFRDLKVNRPTSSAATAIGAGITALMLAHISALEWAHSHSNQRGVDFDISPSDALNQLKTGAKMKKVLQKMATASGTNTSRLFVNPIRFWKNASRNTNGDKQMHLNILKDIDHFVRN